LGREKLWIDVDVDGVSCMGLTYMPAWGILSRKVKKDFLYIPDSEDAWVLECIRSILARRLGRPEVRRRLEDLKSLDVSRLKERMAEGIGGVLAGNIVSSVEKNDWRALEKTRPRIIWALILKDMRNLKWYLLGFLSRLRGFFPLPGRRGVLVAIIGVDGSGKSTLAAGLASRLEDLGFTAEVVYLGMGRERIIPGVRQVGSVLGLSEASQNSSAGVRCGWLQKVLFSVRDGLSLVDYTFRYVTRVHPHVRSGACVITDRYSYDLWERPDAQGWTKNLLVRIFPVPDLLIVLKINPEKIHERRLKLKPEELERRQKSLDILIDCLRKRGEVGILELHPVDLTSSIETVVKALEESEVLGKSSV
jgi:thymidylate kinase